MSSMLIPTKITLNLLRPNSGVVVYAKQYDMSSRVIDVSLVAGNEVWDPPDDAEMMIMYAKPDGTYGVYDVLEDESTPAVVKTGTGEYRITLASQALMVAGNVWVEICFVTQEARSTTMSFIVAVERGTPPDDAMYSDTYFNILSELIQGLLGATTHPPQIDPVTKNWLLWSEESAQYVDSGYSSVGTQGPAGTITVTTETKYQQGTSGTTKPTGTWTTEIPTVSQGNYLWTRTIITFGDGTSQTTYSCARQGRDGSGSVSSVNNISPDNNGNIALTAANIPYGSTTVLARLNELSNKFEYAIYSGVDEYEESLTPGYTSIASAVSYLPNESILICAATEFSSNECPNQNGTVIITKNGAGKTAIEFFGYTIGDGDYRMFVNSSGVPVTPWIAQFQKAVSLSLAANAWTQVGSSSNYTQVITSSIPSAMRHAYTSVDLRYDSDAVDQLVSDGISALYVENNAGVFTIYSVGAVPTEALSLQAVLSEVLT